MIRFEKVVKRFGDRAVLNGISFSVEKGEILFILGTSGTGKSVLLKTLIGLMKADEGAIFVGAEEVSNFSESEYLRVRRKCGMVFQQPALFDSMSIFDNVAFGLRRLEKMPEPQIAKRVHEVLEAVHLPAATADKMPDEISFGMQKRASLARTLALNPEVLLFDEPTTGLDPITTSAINTMIGELSRTLQTTSVVVSHDMACALAIADRIIVLDQGKIVDQGSPAQLKKSKVPLVRDFLAEVWGAAAGCDLGNQQ